MAIQFSDTSAAKNGLIQECESMLYGDDYGAISGSTKKLATFTRSINNGLNLLVGLILASDTRWQFHDSNFTTHPIGKTALVDGQQDYKLSDIHLKVEHVYVKDENGKDYPLIPLDEHDLAKNGVAPSEFMDTNGRPVYYDKKGRSIFLYPAPDANNVTLTEGLVVSYQSSPSYFATTDTDKVAGVYELFQVFPAIVAAQQYAENNDMPTKATKFMARQIEMQDAIEVSYNKRGKDEKAGLKTRKKNYA